MSPQVLLANNSCMTSFCFKTYLLILLVNIVTSYYLRFLMIVNLLDRSVKSEGLMFYRCPFLTRKLWTPRRLRDLVLDRTCEIDSDVLDHLILQSSKSAKFVPTCRPQCQVLDVETQQHIGNLKVRLERRWVRVRDFAHPSPNFCRSKIRNLEWIWPLMRHKQDVKNLKPILGAPMMGLFSLRI